jgi:hypothetical protein
MLPEGPRKPLPATIRDTVVERRHHRFTPDPCAACRRDAVRVMLRTDYVLYLRCEHCLTMCTVPKPGTLQFGT